MIETQKHIRKPLYVDAVRITNANFDEIATWCQGEIEQEAVSSKGASKQYIKVRVHNPKNSRQTKAFVGDWLLYTERGYKVYTNRAFHASFDPVADLPYGTETPGEDVVTPPTPIEEFAPAAMTEDETRQSMGFQPMSPEMAQALETIEADGGTVEPATPQGIADVVEEQQPLVQADDGIALADSPTAPPVPEGKTVLTLEDQATLSQEEIRELLKSGEYILAQDLAA